MTEKTPVPVRQTLQILDVDEPTTVGAKNIPKLTFRAQDVQGRALKFFTFKPSLFSAVQAAKGKSLDADVVVSSRPTEDGNVFVDRKVVQVYQDGKPVGSQQERAAWGGGFRAESPDARASIEAQTAYNGAIKLIANQVSPVDQLLHLTLAGMAAIQAAKQHMGAAPTTNGQAKATASGPPSLGSPAAETPVPQNAQPPAGAGQGAAPTPDETLPVFKVPGDFMTWVHRLWPKVTATEVCKALTVKTIGDIKDFVVAANWLLAAWPKEKP